MEGVTYFKSDGANYHRQIRGFQGSDGRFERFDRFGVTHENPLAPPAPLPPPKTKSVPKTTNIFLL